MMPVWLQIVFAATGIVLQLVTIGIMLYYGSTITSKITNVNLGGRSTNIQHADHVEFRDTDRQARRR